MQLHICCCCSAGPGPARIVRMAFGLSRLQGCSSLAVLLLAQDGIKHSQLTLWQQRWARPVQQQQLQWCWHRRPPCLSLKSICDATATELATAWPRGLAAGAAGDWLTRDIVNVASNGHGSSIRLAMVLDLEPVMLDLDPMVLDRDPVMVNLDPMALDSDPLILDLDPMVLDLDPVVLDLDPVALDLGPAALSTCVSGHWWLWVTTALLFQPCSCFKQPYKCCNLNWANGNASLHDTAEAAICARCFVVLSCSVCLQTALGPGPYEVPSAVFFLGGWQSPLLSLAGGPWPLLVGWGPTDAWTA